jgi:protocatechuate 3,4-dioxygenase beta subunit
MDRRPQPDPIAPPPKLPTQTFEGRPLANPAEDIYDQGLAFDVETLLDRRRMLKLLGFTGLSAGLVVLAGCAPSAGASSAGASSAASASATAAASAAAGTAAADCAVIPEETAGPFPGDGSNGPDVLSQSGVVRADIRSSFGTYSGTAAGVPLTIKLAIQDLANGCAPLAKAAVYVWHCDRDGNYSLYSQAAASQNYLRGVQEAGADGIATFQSIFPACYSGRWPHIHFEVYPNLAAATDDANKIATSQIALPKETCDAVYATDGYAQSVRNLRQVSLTSDMVFADDGGIHEIGTVSGSASAGYTVTLAVPVQAS